MRAADGQMVQRAGVERTAEQLGRAGLARSAMPMTDATPRASRAARLEGIDAGARAPPAA